MVTGIFANNNHVVLKRYTGVIFSFFPDVMYFNDIWYIPTTINVFELLILIDIKSIKKKYHLKYFLYSINGRQSANHGFSSKLTSRLL